VKSISVYIGVSIAIVVVGVFLMSYFSTSPSCFSIFPRSGNSPYSQLIDANEAERLAECSVNEIKSNGYRFGSVSGVWENGTNGISELKAVKVIYYRGVVVVESGTLTVTEDPQLTKVINVTVWRSPGF
jgi:hypothetical protein